MTPVLRSPTELESVTSDLAAAFQNYPLCKWLFRRNPNYTAAVHELVRLLLQDIGYRFGEIYQGASGGGAAVWLWPDKYKLKTGCAELLDKLSHFSSEQEVARLSRTSKRMEEFHPASPHVYLYLLGVRPEFQRHGLGSSLLREGLQIVDRCGLPTFLETADEHNIGFYARWGFSVIDSYIVQAAAPRTWTMWRPATRKP